MLSIPPGKHLNVYPRGWCVCDQYIVSVHSHVLCTEKTRLSHTLYCTLLSFVTQTGLVVSAVFTTALLKSFAMNDHIFSLICNPPWTMTFIKYHKKKKKTRITWVLTAVLISRALEVVTLFIKTVLFLNQPPEKCLKLL